MLCYLAAANENVLRLNLIDYTSFEYLKQLVRPNIMGSCYATV